MTEVEFHQFLKKIGVSGITADFLQAEFVSHIQQADPSKISSSSETLTDLFEVESSRDEDVSKSAETLWDLFDEDILEAKHVALQERTILLQRYEDQGLLGEGGMGEVRRVRDPDLLRNLAMKIAHPKLSKSRGALARFIEEAQVCAQLQHPNIVPVYELGTLDDGSQYYTMKEIEGRSFEKNICDLHAGIQKNEWPTEGITLRRCIADLLEVCEAMAFAHSKGVVHRDLKPENIMIGSFGEVLVVDWGLVKILGRKQEEWKEEQPNQDVESTRSQNQANKTRVGQVAGTPAYMAPEQAMGQVDDIDGRTDVYALGAILYEILSGKPPYEGQAMDVVLQVRTRPPLPLQEFRSIAFEEGLEQESLDTEHFTNQDMSRLLKQAQSGPPIPRVLLEICERAMARNQDERYVSALEMAQELRAFLEGTKKREQAQLVVQRAKKLATEIQEIQQKIQEIHRYLDENCVENWATIEEKKNLWEREQQCEVLEMDIQQLEGEQEYLLRAAFTHVPNFVESHRHLVRLYKKWHQKAETSGKDKGRTSQLLKTLERHSKKLPPNEAEPLFKYIEGQGNLSLFLEEREDISMTIYLEIYVEESKRLIAKFVEQSNHVENWQNKDIAMGNYRLRIAIVRKDRSVFEFVIPFSIHRQEQVFLGSKDSPIPLEDAGDNCYVPKGEVRLGGDDYALNGLDGNIYDISGFVMTKYPITNREYIAFLNDLYHNGRKEEALQYAPKEGDKNRDETMYDMDGSGFLPSSDPDSVVQGWDWPVCYIDWYCANAYAKWLSEKTGFQWRLPNDLEWEKAARGTDERLYPWGNRFDFLFCCIEDSQEDPSPVSIQEFSFDESPYGIRHMAGNMSEWTDSFWRPNGPEVEDNVPIWDDEEFEEDDDKVIRGGYWEDYPRRTRCACRDDGSIVFRDNYVGFRLVYSVYTR
jgi:eukaryotic-like serine/threonine-protein kinase